MNGSGLTGNTLIRTTDKYQVVIENGPGLSKAGMVCRVWVKTFLTTKITW